MFQIRFPPQRRAIKWVAGTPLASTWSTPTGNARLQQEAPAGIGGLWDGPKVPSTMGTLPRGVIPTAECPEVANRQGAPSWSARVQNRSTAAFVRALAEPVGSDDFPARLRARRMPEQHGTDYLLLENLGGTECA